jgi:hypothetical protein
VQVQAQQITVFKMNRAANSAAPPLLSVIIGERSLPTPPAEAAATSSVCKNRRAKQHRRVLYDGNPDWERRQPGHVEAEAATCPTPPHNPSVPSLSLPPPRPIRTPALPLARLRWCATAWLPPHTSRAHRQCLSISTRSPRPARTTVPDIHTLACRAQSIGRRYPPRPRPCRPAVALQCALASLTRGSIDDIA